MMYLMILYVNGIEYSKTLVLAKSHDKVVKYARSEAIALGKGIPEWETGYNVTLIGTESEFLANDPYLGMVDTIKYL